MQGRRMSRPRRELQHMGDNSEKTPPDAEWPPRNPPGNCSPAAWTSAHGAQNLLKVVRIRAPQVFNNGGRSSGCWPRQIS